MLERCDRRASRGVVIGAGAGNRTSAGAIRQSAGAGRYLTAHCQRADNCPDRPIRVRMVFQRPNPFPKSIYDNVVYGLRLLGIGERRLLDAAAERALRAAALWHEVKDRLRENALKLSTGQQQRLVIARTIAIEPEVLLLDEPTSALDPISTLTIEELMISLKAHFTLVLVTHNMQQAARVSDATAFLHQGKLVEYAATDRLFTAPAQRKTEEYITGRLR